MRAYPAVQSTFCFPSKGIKAFKTGSAIGIRNFGALSTSFGWEVVSSWESRCEDCITLSRQVRWRYLSAIAAGLTFVCSSEWMGERFNSIPITLGNSASFSFLVSGSAQYEVWMLLTKLKLTFRADRDNGSELGRVGNEARALKYFISQHWLHESKKNTIHQCEAIPSFLPQSQEVSETPFLSLPSVRTTRLIRCELLEDIKIHLSQSTVFCGTQLHLRNCILAYPAIFVRTEGLQPSRCA